MNFFSIRKDIYTHNFSQHGSLINIRSPYTYIKSLYYIESAALFLFLTQNIIKSPNFITLLYVITGVSGAFLLNNSQDNFFYLGLFMIFTKGTFDWADGPLARRLDKTSFIGHALDSYGAHLSDAAFRVAFLYFTIGYFSDLEYLLPILTFIILVTNFRLFSDFQYLKLNKENAKKNSRDEKAVQDFNTKEKKINNFKKWYVKYIAFLDGRSRNIDSMLLLLLIHKKFDYDLSIFLLILSALIILRCVLMHIVSVYSSFRVYRGR